MATGRRASSAEASGLVAALVNTPCDSDEKLKRPALIGQYILLGSIDHATEVAENTWQGPGEVGGVVNAMPSQGFMRKIYKDLPRPVGFLNIEVEDEEGAEVLGEAPDWLNARAVVEFIKEHAVEGRRVLIHCKEGRNRSATLAVAALMLHEGRELVDAVKEVWDKRPFVLQNASFRDQLGLLAEQIGLGPMAPGTPGIAAPAWQRRKSVSSVSFGNINITTITQDKNEKPRSSSKEKVGEQAKKEVVTEEGSDDSSDEEDEEAVKAEEEKLDSEIKEMEQKLTELYENRRKMWATRGKIAPMNSLGTDQLDSKHVMVGTKVGSGFFGVVYDGTWRGIKVALKFCAPEAFDELKKECMLLDELEHPNIMRMYGVCVGSAPATWPADVQPPCICCELLSEGTLLDYVRKSTHESRVLPEYWTRCNYILVGSAKGVGYLHDVGIMHRDLKCENILIDANGEAKIADFGVSKHRDKKLLSRRNTPIGTYSHMAPEVMKGSYELSADVFSFGICLTEVICGDEGAEIIDETRSSDFGLKKEGVLEFIHEDHFPPCSFELVEIAVLACNMEPSERPSPKELVQKLDGLSKPSQTAKPPPTTSSLVKRKATISGDVTNVWEKHLRRVTSVRVADGKARRASVELAALGLVKPSSAPAKMGRSQTCALESF